jgi:galactokinase/mevalonate kinase-like predicted kinase
MISARANFGYHETETVCRFNFHAILTNRTLPTSMPNTLPPLEILLSLPPCVVNHAQESDGAVFCDPPDTKLGSGGGTAHLLHAAMQRDNAPDFRAWLRGSRKLMVHGGGQSRRLPAYAAIGKPLIPLPLLRGVYGQTSDQTLLTFQTAAFERVFHAAPVSSVAMIASGDVLLRFGRKLPPFPDADVIALGMDVSPHVAQHFGVFFLSPHSPQTCAFFLQKPAPERIQEFAGQYRFLVDTGMWLLSERAVLTLMQKCGWNDAEQRFENGLPRTYELYAEFGLALGTESPVRDPDINGLTCAVVPLPQPEFYHLGTSRQLIESVTELQNRLGQEGVSHISGLGSASTVHVQNAQVDLPVHSGRHSNIWIENAHIPASWTLHSDHVLTNIPENQWTLDLPAGVCVDMPPLNGSERVMRVYGINDSFSGRIGDPSTLWFGRPAVEWFSKRGITLEDARISPDTDVQQAALFPVDCFPAIHSEGFHPQALISWMIAVEPAESDNAEFRDWYLDPLRFSAEGIGAVTNVAQMREERERFEKKTLMDAMYADDGAFFRMDLGRTAHRFEQMGLIPTTEWNPHLAPMNKTHALMFEATGKRMRGRDDWQQSEAAAFAALREAILTEAQMTPVAPRRAIQDDQIVWGRSPVRLDLAGGWTDTPPYCQEHGGKVVNLAVNLNGQPPVQVFARLIESPEFILRSIDRGEEERVGTYDALDTYTQVGSAFALPKAALALCGFLPRFHAGRTWKTLQEQLTDFGGGLEISLLAAVPSGSGLGTSSILASTILGTLNDVCGLGWDRFVLMERTLMVEQMLTTGGGWQDQAGGLFRGIKLLETVPGIRQEPTVRWLPEHLFAGDANKANLLYYTGLTRLAKNILQEIVRGMFLNNRDQLEVLRDLEANALATFDAIQRADRDALCRCVAANWILNKRLDSGTNTPGVQAILEQISDLLAGAKLLGAGGGGYLLMMAKDEDAAARIRRSLTDNPPNTKARFVNFDVSSTGLEVTRS